MKRFKNKNVSKWLSVLDLEGKPYALTVNGLAYISLVDALVTIGGKFKRDDVIVFRYWLVDGAPAGGDADVFFHYRTRMACSVTIHIGMAVSDLPNVTRVVVGRAK